MRVLRGRAADVTADRERTARILAEAGERREPALRVWTPHRQLAFGRRDTNEAGYDRAVAIAREYGFPPIDRSVGGRAVAYTGTTLAFAHAIPIDDLRRGMDARYERASERVRAGLRTVGVEAERGEPPESYCPGDHSLSASGKLVGIAQRITAEAALVSGVVIVDGHEEIAGVLSPVYEALSVPFDRDSVGSVERAGGDADPERVARAIEDAILDGRTPRIERIGPT
ncbi:lipoate--protein ligase family protein [Natronorarus salvus]|uniref:lipoate--protein ligase family protein n=1 Tax=Natronorarus salvus TaxID=3117733 RepID=UPI002F260EF7